MTVQEALRVQIPLKLPDRIRKERNDSRRQKKSAKDLRINSKKFKYSSKRNQLTVYKNIVRVKALKKKYRK